MSGNQSEGIAHLGVLQEWFGVHWWNSRAYALLFIVLFVMLPLVAFRRIGKAGRIRFGTDFTVFSNLKLVSYGKTNEGLLDLYLLIIIRFLQLSY